MTRKFVSAMQTNDALTENAMVTHSTSGSELVNLFFRMGGMRTKENEIVLDFVRAMNENKLLALKCMFYNRDIRGGQGERETFRAMFRHLANYYPDLAKKLLIHIPFYGRWDDVLFCTINTPIEIYGLDLCMYGLKSGDKLCAKWMPRENKSHKDIAKKLAHYIFNRTSVTLSEEGNRWVLRNYRKLLAGNTQVVETLMCRKEWGEIKYSQVPSNAFAKYRKAFARHDPERFKKFLEKVLKGEAEIKAGAIFPNDIIKPLVRLMRSNISYFGKQTIHSPEKSLLDACQAQWQNLPNYFPNDEDFYVLPVCDVSGSMTANDYLPLDVSISLGIYCAERNYGSFKDLVITFSKRPTFIELKGNNIWEKILNFSRINLAENTNLEATFRLILDQAGKNNLPAKYMPRILLIISDMQFDQCAENYSDNAMQMIDRMYSRAGYKRPQIVFWNLRTSSGIPTKYDEKGTALVSGFSPSIIKQVLGGELEPIKVVLRTLNSERYERIVV